MEWDSRVWIIFIWMVGAITIMFAFGSPYHVPGNRVNTVIAFGGDIVPVEAGGVRYGLWGEIPEEVSGYFRFVQVTMCLAVLSGVGLGLITLIGVVKWGENNRMVQIMCAASLIVGGVAAEIAVGTYRANSSNLGQAWWMTMSSGWLFILSGVSMILYPTINREIIRKRYVVDDEAEAAIPLKTV